MKSTSYIFLLFAMLTYPFFVTAQEPKKEEKKRNATVTREFDWLTPTNYIAIHSDCGIRAYRITYTLSTGQGTSSAEGSNGSAKGGKVTDPWVYLRDPKEISAYEPYGEPTCPQDQKIKITYANDVNVNSYQVEIKECKCGDTSKIYSCSLTRTSVRGATETQKLKESEDKKTSMIEKEKPYYASLHANVGYGMYKMTDKGYNINEASSGVKFGIGGELIHKLSQNITLSGMVSLNYLKTSGSSSSFTGDSISSTTTNNKYGVENLQADIVPKINYNLPNPLDNFVVSAGPVAGINLLNKVQNSVTVIETYAGHSYTSPGNNAYNDASNVNAVMFGVDVGISYHFMPFIFSFDWDHFFSNYQNIPQNDNHFGSFNIGASYVFNYVPRNENTIYEEQANTIPVPNDNEKQTVVDSVPPPPPPPTIGTLGPDSPLICYHIPGTTQCGTGPTKVTIKGNGATKVITFDMQNTGECNTRWEYRFVAPQPPAPQPGNAPPTIAGGNGDFTLLADVDPGKINSVVIDNENGRDIIVLYYCLSPVNGTCSGKLKVTGRAKATEDNPKPPKATDDDYDPQIIPHSDTIDLVPLPHDKNAPVVGPLGSKCASLVFKPIIIVNKSRIDKAFTIKLTRTDKCICKLYYREYTYKNRAAGTPPPDEEDAIPNPQLGAPDYPLINGTAAPDNTSVTLISSTKIKNEDGTIKTLNKNKLKAGWTYVLYLRCLGTSKDEACKVSLIYTW